MLHSVLQRKGTNGRRAEEENRMGSYATHGPLGSTDADCPIAIDGLYDVLRAEDATLGDSWGESDVREWAKTLGLPCVDSTL